MRVEIGNADVVQVENQDGSSVRMPVEGQRVTYVDIPDGVSLGEAFVNITDPRGAWAAVSDGTPAWVACDNAALQGLLAEHFSCEAGHPADLEANWYTLAGPPGTDGSEKEGTGNPEAAAFDAIVDANTPATPNDGTVQ